MKVINVAGFHVKFEKFGRTYNIPSDGLLHVIPDECFYEDNFQGLLRVIVPPNEVKQVIRKIENPRFIDFNEPNIKEIIIEKVEEEKNCKPLKGIRLNSGVRKGLRKSKPTGKKKLENEEAPE